MRGNAVTGAMFTLLLISILDMAFDLPPVKAEPRTWTVDDDRPADFNTIQEAINAANLGDTIYVQNGAYYEKLMVNKSNLTLVGENRNLTVIDGGGRETVSIRANNIKITGFTIRNGYTGIQMPPWSHGHSISDNIITNNDFGISGHYDVYNITICDNIIIANNFVGIDLVFYDSIVSDNIISNNGKGDSIGLTAGILIGEGVNNKTISSNNNMIMRNTMKNNYNGILMAKYSEGNIFYHNTFMNNTNQVQPSYMSNNTIQENYWSDYIGEDKDGDGIGDTPYIISVDVKDNFPLMTPFYYWSNPIDGDVYKDMKVNIHDIAIAAKAFGSYLGHPRWDMQADINQDNKVDIKDLVLIAKNFGKSYQQKNSGE